MNPTITIDLYGNVFLNGENTNSQIADFARNNPELAPQVDGAVRQAALDARAYIAAQTATLTARVVQLEAALRTAGVAVPAAPTP
jgi:hypothetical protein